MLSTDTQLALKNEIARQKLPSDFFSATEEFLLPVVESFLNQEAKRSRGAPFLLGLQGSQGSGKSTSAKFIKIILEQEFAKNTLIISIDDFYLTKYQRRILAAQVHPLFATRGVPGTHDVAMLQQCIAGCSLNTEHHRFRIPRFDKAIDDRAKASEWTDVVGATDVIILEGWCVGIPAQTGKRLMSPINDLESQLDSDAIWRTEFNRRLNSDYAELFSKIDYLVALQVPSFDCVFEWRLLQEQKLKERLECQGKSTANLFDAQTLRHFISHYERLSRHALTQMPEIADALLALDHAHRFEQLFLR